MTLPLARSLTLRAENTLSFASQSDAVFPDRSTFGLEWGVRRGVGLRLSQTFFSRGQYAGRSLTSLESTSDYKPGANTDCEPVLGSRAASTD